jgi:hypothetical protein
MNLENPKFLFPAKPFYPVFSTPDDNFLNGKFRREISKRRKSPSLVRVRLLHLAMLLARLLAMKPLPQKKQRPETIRHPNQEPVLVFHWAPNWVTWQRSSMPR